MRILRAVASGTPIQVRAWLEKNHAPLYIWRAELHQKEEMVAWGQGKFMDVSFLKK